MVIMYRATVANEAPSRQVYGVDVARVSEVLRIEHLISDLAYIGRSPLMIGGYWGSPSKTTLAKVSVRHGITNVSRGH